MKKRRLRAFIEFLQKKAEVYAPVEEHGGLFVKKIASFDEIKFSREVPLTTFKQVLLPQRQVMFDYKKNRVLTEVKEAKPMVAFGLTIPDLKAVGLFNQVFERDPYYQAQRQKNLIIGLAPVTKSMIIRGPLRERYEEDILEHLIFDIFLGQLGPDEWSVFTGSEKGQRALETFGFSDYEHVEFAGLIKEEGSDPNLATYRQRVVQSHAKRIWDYWGSRCLACGKCAVDCPTCFCFDINDEPDEAVPGSGQRVRQWTTCFYNDFAAIGGGTQTFQPKNGQRIENWYLHKFLRIPREFQIIGCVNCGRCDRVCPVGITRHDVLTSLEHPDDAEPRHLRHKRSKQTEHA